MKFQILQEKLKEGLSIIERITSKSLTLPILNNVLIVVEKSFLNLSITDLEIGIKWWTLIKVEGEGKTTIPSKLMLNFVNLLPNKKIEISEKNNSLNIECGEYKTKINGISADEYPLIPNVEKEEFVSLNGPLFCRDLAQVADIPTPSNTRPEISGLYFSFQKDSITIAATDSFRLGEKKIILKGGSSLGKGRSLILPQKTVKEIINIFGEKDTDLKIYFSPNQIMFESLMDETDHPQIQVVSRLIEGDYPNYQEIIPKKFTTQLILNKDEFLNQIKTASLFSGKVSEIKLKINPAKKELQILSQSSELGEHQSSIFGEVKGEDIELTFNYKFLIDGISRAKGAEIIFELNGDSGPGVIKSSADNTYTYVVMPIKSS
jgi:DNA polymerase III subunit beta